MGRSSKRFCLHTFLQKEILETRKFTDFLSVSSLKKLLHNTSGPHFSSVVVTKALFEKADQFCVSIIKNFLTENFLFVFSSKKDFLFQMFLEILPENQFVSPTQKKLSARRAEKSFHGSLWTPKSFEKNMLLVERTFHFPESCCVSVYRIFRWLYLRPTADMPCATRERWQVGITSTSISNQIFWCWKKSFYPKETHILELPKLAFLFALLRNEMPQWLVSCGFSLGCVFFHLMLHARGQLYLGLCFISF